MYLSPSQAELLFSAVKTIEADYFGKLSAPNKRRMEALLKLLETSNNVPPAEYEHALMALRHTKNKAKDLAQMRAMAVLISNFELFAAKA